jgi:hypothetical protein
MRGARAQVRAKRDAGRVKAQSAEWARRCVAEALVEALAEWVEHRENVTASTSHLVEVLDQAGADAAAPRLWRDCDGGYPRDWHACTAEPRLKREKEAMSHNGSALHGDEEVREFAQRVVQEVPDASVPAAGVRVGCSMQLQQTLEVVFARRAEARGHWLER